MMLPGFETAHVSAHVCMVVFSNHLLLDVELCRYQYPEFVHLS